ncbi:alpha/beta fold hydrolase [Yoonia litorea]|uniref:Pimeloyl-ACP methyl ester carboxylesterase n=1 Tax=Yoonia litorea TaxID=1123755 RepID=A0A1I6MX41_9RHOB|nr:alpha/beta hydrolase [Yoonia litorea]SFS20283.1 Pimeloyl-ACP methyl ester carboxylesterase [Yoonia litorea]
MRIWLAASEVNSPKVHHVTLGSDASRLFIHCMLARHELLLPLATALGGGKLMDLPGHGQSPDWDGRTPYQALATRMAAACCDGPTHVIGHSFGATVALRLAVERPDLVNRLTLIEPVFFAAAKGTTAHGDYLRTFRPFVMAMLQGDEARAAEIFNSVWSTSRWDSIPAAQRAYLTERIHLIVATGADLEEDSDGITSPARLSEVNVPVTLIRGDQTQPIIADIHASLCARLPHAADHVVAGAGHMVPIRDRFIPEIARIIRAAETGTG